MKLKGKLLFLATFFAVVIPLIFITGYAGATPSYKGDGAVPNGSGGWTWTPVPFPTEGVQCLDCHGTGGWTGIAPDKTSYLMTGHKNMLRKVLPTGPAWNRADGTPYCSSYASCTPPGMWTDPGNLSATLNWALGTITYSPWLGTMLGTPTTVPLYYIVDAWMDPTQMNTIFQGGFTGELPGDYGVNFPGGTYMCARCHTTGYDFRETGPEPNTSPYGASSLTYPNPHYISGGNLSRIPTDFAVTDSAGNIVCSDSTNTYCVSSWYLNGIQCERCHGEGGHGYIPGSCSNTNSSCQTNQTTCQSSPCNGTWTPPSYPVFKPTNDAATKLCLECHRQETANTGSCSDGVSTNPVDCGSGTWTNDQSITLTTDLMVSGAPSCPCSDGVTCLNKTACLAITGNTWDSTSVPCSDGVTMDEATCLAISGNTWSWEATALNGSGLFFDTNPGQTFLNSPHARFSGTLGQNAQNSPDLSVSLFGTYNSLFGSPNQGGCTTCHDVHQSVVPEVGALMPIKKTCDSCHTSSGDRNAPQVAATTNHPTGTGTPQECSKCHMPTGTTGSYHLMRISVDPSYSTFPTPAQYYLSSQTIANTASDGSFTSAVWNDLDLACGQCHGPAGSAKHFFKKDAKLSTFATGIHTGTAPSTTCTNCHPERVATMNHPQAAMYTALTCESCHAIPGTTRPGVNPGIIPCAQCHGAGQVWPLTDAVLTARANGIHQSKPDYVVLNTYVTPTTVAPSGSVSITDVTVNQSVGGAGAAPSTTAFYVVSACTTTPSGSPAATRTVPALAAGANSSGTTPVPMPSSPGTYYIVAKANDNGGAGTESNPNNNTKCSSAITVVGALPDLYIAAVSAPASATHNIAFSVSDRTANKGAANAGVSTTSVYVADGDLTGSCPTSGAGATLLNSRAVPIQVPGGGNTGSMSVTIATTGTKTLIWMADSGGVVSEGNENNNTYCKKITVN